MIKTETLQFKVLYDTRDGVNNLGYLEESYRKLTDARRGAKSVADEKEIIKQQDILRTKINEQREALGNLGLTTTQLRSKIKDLNYDLSQMIPSSEKAQEFKAELEQLREILKGKGDASHLDREIDALRLIINDSGTAELSTKQLEQVAKHMYSTMVTGAKSGSIANHELYNEWLNVTQAIQKSTDSLNYNKIAQKAYEADLNRIVKAQGIQGLNLNQLEDYSKQLYTTIVEESKNGEIGQHKLYNEWLNTTEAITINKDALDKNKIAQEQYEEVIRQTIKTHGLEGLSLKQLEDHNKQLYATITTGARAGKMEEHALYAEWVKSNAIIKQSKNSLNQVRIAQDEYDKQLRDTVKTQGIQALSLQHLREYYKLLKQEIAETSDFESEANKKRIEEAQEVKKLADEKDKEVEGTSSFFSQIKAQLPAAVAGAFGGMFVGISQEIGEMVFSAISEVAEKIKKRAREITEIEVALDTTRATAMKLHRELNNIETETPVGELQKLVVVAGDLNVATNEVRDFVKEADKIGLVLGSDFGGSTEEAITMIAKLKGEFKETKDLSFGDALAKIGSTLKGLNLDGPASTQGITDFLKRAGAIPAALKPSITELASYAAIFEEANMTSEVSASGFSKILTVGANNLSAFAKQMKMSRAELAGLINSNPNEFVIKFTQSLQGLSGTQTAQTLKKLRLESDETFKVVGVLSDNIDKLNQKQETSNTLFSEGTAIQKIFSKYQNDEAGQIAQIEKAWGRVTSSLTNFLVKVAGPIILFLGDTAKKSKDLSEIYIEKKKNTDNVTNAAAKLITKYNDLAEKAKTNTKLQKELNGVMSQIANIVPEAVTQYDKFGNAISVNIGLLEKYIKKQQEATKAAKFDAIDDLAKQNNKMGGERAQLNAVLLTMTKTEADRVINAKKIKVYTDSIKDLSDAIVENKKQIKNFNTDQVITPVNTDPPDTNTNDTGGGNEDSSSKKIAHQKYIQESAKQLIELEAKLAFEENLASANEHQKKILQAEKQAQDELKQIRTQFKDENGLVIEQSKQSIEQKQLIAREEALVAKKLTEQKNQLQKELDEKLNSQYEAQANRSMEIAIASRRDKLNANLEKAKYSGTNLDIQNAEIDLQSNAEKETLYNLEKKYLEEQKALKDNEKALVLLEKNYQDEKNRITEKGIQDRDKIIFDGKEREKQREAKSKLDSKALDVKAAEQKPGGDVFQAQKDLLDQQMNQELKVANLTEAEKLNIQRRYALERAALERASFQQIAQESVSLFSQAYSAISNVFKGSLASKEQEQQEAYNRDKALLDEQKDKKVLTEKQYNDKVVALNKKLDKEQRKIKREQAIIDRVSNVAQITVSGILAAMKAYEQSGPFGGTIGAAIMAGITALNIAAVASEPLPSLLVGGKTNDIHPGSNIDGNGGFLAINHPNEFMSNPIATSNPVWPVFEPMLEMLNAGGTPSFLAGGRTTTGKNNFSENTSSTALAKFETTVDRFAEHVETLGAYVANPAQNYIVFGHKEVYDLEQLKNELNTTLKDANATTNNSLIK